jgi:hypothetical protein
MRRCLDFIASEVTAPRQFPLEGCERGLTKGCWGFRQPQVSAVRLQERERRFWRTARISCALPIFERPSMPSLAASRRSSVTVIAPAPRPVPFDAPRLRAAALAPSRPSALRVERESFVIVFFLRARLGFLDVLARCPSLLLRSHLASILSIKGRMPRPAESQSLPHHGVRVRCRSSNPATKKLLTLLRAFTTLPLRTAEEIGEFGVSFPLGVLDVGFEPQRITQTLLDEPDDVVVPCPWSQCPGPFLGHSREPSIPRRHRLPGRLYPLRAVPGTRVGQVSRCLGMPFASSLGAYPAAPPRFRRRPR